MSNNQIYCEGPLLHTVQMAHLFKDSKTFVDMKLKYSPEETNLKFTEFMTSKNNTPTEDDIREFVNNHFDDLGKEFVPWLPADWKEHPAFLDSIYDPDLKQWASDLNGIWKDLGRKMIDDVFKNPEYYSIIPVEHPVIVPGGRFIEFYYWDSYWIIRGLLYSEMYSTARGMLENFLSIVKRFGFIPNGGRIYYATRSQPPLLTAMIKSYVDFTQDEKFALDALEILEHEFEYWMNNHTVQAKGHDMATYGGSSKGPRPESYREDVITSNSFVTNEEKENHYSELKAAAESGMDFSSRWFINENGTTQGNLTDLKTRSIVPVELNAILYWNAKIIAEFHLRNNNVSKMTEYMNKAEKILEAIQDVHWNEEVGAWLDYDLINNKQRDYFVPTNLAPLWTKAFDIKDSEKISKAVLQYIENNRLDNYPGGVPNTLYHTGEQWDFPNVWPPMQYILIEGLKNLDTPEAKNLSTSWAERWVKSNFEAYRETRNMFEKYDAEHFGGHGGGGEYEVQKGFGWSNGVILELLAKHGRQLSVSTDGAVQMNVMNIVGVTAITLIATILARLMW
ncbi:trehalase isoform X1 [Teleopsis dalmanni]|uniref:trehalase isoform X1 n=1 Tax=Teleopsis dalmanni TaxID=139649 RepID=UPI0018CEF29D|nr:trehalase isoform X1 [Teleopsis dalmanni]XP_037944959.1 trehalase isoform X1 [Teleopsis dalmanni]